MADFLHDAMYGRWERWSRAGGAPQGMRMESEAGITVDRWGAWEQSNAA